MRDLRVVAERGARGQTIAPVVLFRVRIRIAGKRIHIKLLEQDFLVSLVDAVDALFVTHRHIGRPWHGEHHTATFAVGVVAQTLQFAIALCVYLEES